MLSSQCFITTLRETPSDAEIISHQLMLKAGLIRKLGSGLYTWMPLGLKILRKVEAVVREEMNKAGAIELLLPEIIPAELWQETGRWETFGGQLLKITDNAQREYCFGPTHEEVITDLFRNEVKSYKQLPINLYQIQTKFRDEIRPRFGVMRAREFLMKDAYSFHLTEACLEKTYQKMYTAYSNIFTRLGLNFRAVEADTGAIGGSTSHEFQVLAESGEDLIAISDASSYAANVEQAISLVPEISRTIIDSEITKIATPNQKTIEAVSQFLNVEPAKIIKTLLVKGRIHPIVALVLRGDDSLNEIKAAKHPHVQSPLEFLSEEEIKTNFGAEAGSIGPVGLNIPIIVDHFAAQLSTFICGANETDFHLQNACWERDVQPTELAYLRQVKAGDESPDGKGNLTICRGIEVGHIFQLGDKYTQAMKVTVMNENGASERVLMGTYGIGVSRIVAAAIEQHHDKKGILWPETMAPFQVVIIPINADRVPAVKQAANDLYQYYLDKGIEVLLEDRNERPGVLFNDHDLIGIPHRIIISEQTLQKDSFEYRKRSNEESQLILLNERNRIFSN